MSKSKVFKKLYNEEIKIPEFPIINNKIRILVLGDKKVGKSNFIRLASNNLLAYENKKRTFLKTKIAYGNIEVIFYELMCQIKKITSQLKKIHSIICMFSIIDKESFNLVYGFYNEIKFSCSCPFYIIGSKLDLIPSFKKSKIPIQNFELILKDLKLYGSVLFCVCNDKYANNNIIKTVCAIVKIAKYLAGIENQLNFTSDEMVDEFHIEFFKKK